MAYFIVISAALFVTAAAILAMGAHARRGPVVALDALRDSQPAPMADSPRDAL